MAVRKVSSFRRSGRSAAFSRQSTFKKQVIGLIPHPCDPLPSPQCEVNVSMMTVNASAVLRIRRSSSPCLRT
ncbi:hypothetical protein AMELA_G00287010 [Ameiurus melas]|uniref:Uncharacterized protein n=1 Tax=Ameiurus melas TaxID=219545 RepID=A0A7J5ZIT0_AMEME|nr:hypothetical protein AMELA_G00287010 [Ameiurus melas]